MAEREAERDRERETETETETETESNARKEILIVVAPGWYMSDFFIPLIFSSLKILYNKYCFYNN